MQSKDEHEQLVHQVSLLLERYDISPNENDKNRLKESLTELQQHKAKLAMLPNESEHLEQTTTLIRKLKRRLLETIPVKHHTKTKWQFFKGEHGRQLLEIESALGDLYRLLINDHAPKMRTVIDAETKIRTGVMSKPIPGYSPFSNTIGETLNKTTGEYENVYDIIDNDKLVKGGIAKVLVAAYACEETDLHWGNIGLDTAGNVVKIDHDRSAWTWTKKYFDSDSEYHVTIDSRDIETFPVLHIAQPGEWIGNPYQSPRTPELPKLCDNREFQNEKWLTFLKVVLIDKNMLTQIAQDHFSSTKGEEKFVNLFVERFATLKTELLKIPQFKAFVLEITHLPESLLSDFEKYNQEFKNPKHEHRRILLNEINANFLTLKNDVTLVEAQLQDNKLQ